MPEKDSEEVIRSVRSHMGRVKEAKGLLDEGKPLSLLTTPIEGPSEEYLRENRQRFIDEISAMDTQGLNQLLGEIEARIEEVSERFYGGASELNWRRCLIMEKLDGF